MKSNQYFLLFSILGFLLFYSCKDSNTEQSADIQTGQDSVSIDSSNIDFSFLTKESNAYVLPWNYLINVKFEEKFSEKLGMEVSYPIFNDTLKYLDGKTVIIEGFYIPVDETGDDKIVILSAYPFAQCFFCGKAGVESIIDILAPQKLPNLKVDSKIKFKGRLKLNRDNFDYLIYVLEEAEYVSE
jgi:hypothetical protein